MSICSIVEWLTIQMPDTMVVCYSDAHLVNLFWSFFMPFLYNGVYLFYKMTDCGEGSTQNVSPPPTQRCVWGKRVSKMIVPPKEMLL